MERTAAELPFKKRGLANGHRPDTGNYRTRFLAPRFFKRVGLEQRRNRDDRVRASESVEVGTAERRSVRQHQPADRRPDSREGVARRQASVSALLAGDAERTEGLDLVRRASGE